MTSPVDVVQAQLDAYNAQDLDAFCGCFAEECVLAELNGEHATAGLPAIRERYAALFRQYPGNHARLVNRIAVGDVVVDHEDIERAPGLRLELAMIYTVRDGKIRRADAARAHVPNRA